MRERCFVECHFISNLLLGPSTTQCLHSVIAETLVPFTAVMAFMAMRRNLDDRQQKRELDAIFAKFDKNQNGIIHVFCWLKIAVISYVLHHIRKVGS